MLSAGVVTKHGSMIVLDENGGYVIGNESVCRAVRSSMDKAMGWSDKDVVPAHKERGVYNVYVKIKPGAGDLCPMQELGGPRPGRCP